MQMGYAINYIMIKLTLNFMCSLVEKHIELVLKILTLIGVFIVFDLKITRSNKFQTIVGKSN